MRNWAAICKHLMRKLQKSGRETRAEWRNAYFSLATRLSISPRISCERAALENTSLITASRRRAQCRRRPQSFFNAIKLLFLLRISAKTFDIDPDLNAACRLRGQSFYDLCRSAASRVDSFPFQRRVTRFISINLAKHCAGLIKQRYFSFSCI